MGLELWQPVLKPKPKKMVVSDNYLDFGTRSKFIDTPVSRVKRSDVVRASDDAPRIHMVEHRLLELVDELEIKVESLETVMDQRKADSDAMIRRLEMRLQAVENQWLGIGPPWHR